MLHFHCPSCQARCEAAPEFAGKSVVCPKCGKTAEVPRDAGAITAAAPPAPVALPPLTAVTTPDVAEALGARKRREQADEDDRWGGRSIQRDGGAPRSWLRTGVSALVILSIVAIVIALFVPSVEKVRDAAARTQSVNNIKQIGLGCHAFHDTNKRLPFNGSDASPAQAPEIKYTKEAAAGAFTSGSWAFQILPFVDQAPVFNGGRPNVDFGLAIYLCPGRGRRASDYHQARVGGSCGPEQALHDFGRGPADFGVGAGGE